MNPKIFSGLLLSGSMAVLPAAGAMAATGSMGAKGLNSTKAMNKQTLKNSYAQIFVSEPFNFKGRQVVVEMNLTIGVGGPLTMGGQFSIIDCVYKNFRGEAVLTLVDIDTHERLASMGIFVFDEKKVASKKFDLLTGGDTDTCDESGAQLQFNDSGTVTLVMNKNAEQRFHIADGTTFSIKR